MDREEFILLAGKVADGIASDSEVTLYNSYYNAYQHKYPLWEDLDNADREQMLAETEAQIHAQLKPVQGVKHAKLWAERRTKYGMTFRIAAAAAVALVVLGVYFFNVSSPIVNQNSTIVNQNDIAPGKNGAKLTLANGKVIQLSDSKTGVIIGQDLKYSDGTEILRSALNDKKGMDDKDGVLSSRVSRDLVASTTKGQTYIFTLPDGTRVWLNAVSKLIIPSGFSAAETRKVELDGEAYFEVSKDKKRPFIVESNGQEVTVLGTHFNISAYKEERSIKTTLLEGSVKVSASPGGEGEVRAGTSPDGTAVILKPNQQSVVSRANRIAVANVDVNEAVAWKNGDFNFTGENIESIMRELERWYGIEVQFSGPVSGERYYARISRFKNISEVLKMLEKAKGVHFKIEGRRVTVLN